MASAILESRATALGITFSYFDIYGPLVVGNFVGLVLWGVFNISVSSHPLASFSSDKGRGVDGRGEKVYIYFDTIPKDAWYNKATVSTHVQHEPLPVSSSRPLPYPRQTGHADLSPILGAGKPDPTFADRLLVVVPVLPADSAQLLLALSTLDSVMQCIRVVKMTCIHPGDLAYFLMIKDHQEDWIGTLASYLTGAVAQAFMAYRIFSFARPMRAAYSRRIAIVVWAIGVVLLLGTLLCFAASIAQGVYLSQLTSYAEAFSLTSDPTVSGLHRDLLFWSDLQIGSFVACDIVLTIAMTVQIRLAKTGFAQSNHILDTLMAVILRNGLLVTVLQVIQLIVLHRTISAWADFAPAFIGKVYCITIISILCRPKMAQKQYLARLDREAQVGPDGEKFSGPQGYLTSSSGLRCRSCGTATAVGSGMGSSKEVPMSPRLGVQLLREGPVGFRAALMGVDEDEGSVTKEEGGDGDGVEGGGLEGSPKYEDGGLVAPLARFEPSGVAIPAPAESPYTY